MLKLKYLIENFELAKECLSLYDFDEESLDEMLEYFRISSNAVYPFKDGSSPEKVHFLRFSPVEEKSLTNVLSEIRLTQWLVDAGYPVMKPFAMKNGKFADVLDTKWGSYNVSCFSEVPGEDLESIDLTDEIVMGYGLSLGRLHSALKDYPFASERRSHEDMLANIRERLIKYEAPAFMLTELDSVEKELAALPISRDNYGIVHFDYEPDNVFFDSESGAYSAIDFDDAIRCWFALDISRALDALDDIDENESADSAKAAFLEGYRKGCPLSQADEESIPLMRRLVLLKKYSTLLHVLSEPVNEEYEWLTELIEKLNSRLRWVESTVESN